jgi:hypothetical protein
MGGGRGGAFQSSWNMSHIPPNIRKRNNDETTTEACHTLALLVKIPLPYFLGIQLNSKDKMLNIGPFYIHRALNSMAGKARISSRLKNSSFLVETLMRRNLDSMCVSHTY